MPFEIEIQVEMGGNADPDLVDKLVREISSKWTIKRDRPAVPTLVLFGGFQGSGKSTIIDELQKNPESTFIVISPDEIRSKLFNMIPFSDAFVHTVFAARNTLLQKALKTGQNILIDENSTPLRISLFDSFVKNIQGSKYKVLTVFLEVSKETLIQRVKSRLQVQGRYAGKVNELVASIEEHGEIELGAYGIIIDTVKTSSSAAAKIIFNAIQAFQG